MDKSITATRRRKQEEAELRTLIYTKRFWGDMQGLSKKAIESALACGQEEALRTVLIAFAGGGGLAPAAGQSLTMGTVPQGTSASATALAVTGTGSMPVCGNPDRVKGKGEAERNSASGCGCPRSRCPADSPTLAPDTDQRPAYGPYGGAT